MSKLSTLIYKPDAKSRFILAGAASAVALRKGLWRDKQGFSVPARGTWRRTPVRRPAKYMQDKRVETSGERRAGENRTRIAQIKTDLHRYR